MRFATTLAGCLLTLCAPALAQHRPHDAHLPTRSAPAKTPRIKTILTPAEAARILKVRQETINRLFDRGLLKGFRVPGSRARRIPRQTLYDFMKKHGIALPAPRRAGPVVTKPAGWVSGLPTPIGPDGQPWVCFDCNTSPCMCGLSKPNTAPVAEPDVKERDGARQRIDGLLDRRGKRPPQSSRLRNAINRLRQRGNEPNTDESTSDKPAADPQTSDKPAADTPAKEPATQQTADKPVADESADTSTANDARIRRLVERLRRPWKPSSSKPAVAKPPVVEPPADAGQEPGPKLDRLKQIRDSLRRGRRTSIARLQGIRDALRGKTAGAR